jgi:Zn ribbon nucleic-acid-binding protein
MSPEVTFVKHEPCPKCGSRDNLGVWSDGHKWCFGCGHYVVGSGSSLEYLRKLVRAPKALTEDLKLPDSVSFNFPMPALEYLASYGIDGTLISKYKIKWNTVTNSLIYPVYDGPRLVMYQERKLFPVPKTPKYLTVGNLNNFLPVFNDTGDDVSAECVVVVEDFLSAIKVAESSACSMPLFGSYLNKQQATRLSSRYKRLAIWLDQDKAKQAIKFADEYRILFDNLSVINTPEDPKSYSSDDIMEEIWGSFDYDEEKDLPEDKKNEYCS